MFDNTTLPFRLLGNSPTIKINLFFQSCNINEILLILQLRRIDCRENWNLFLKDSVLNSFYHRET